MAEASISTAPVWAEAFADAARGLAHAPPGSLLFLEERGDLRLALDDRGRREAVLTRVHGISLRRGPGPGGYAYRSDPSPEVAARLVALAARGRGGSDAPATARGTHAPVGRDDDGGTRDAVACLERLIAACRKAAGGSGVEWRARWVSFDQTVRIARGDRPPAVDRRSGRRIRLEARRRAGAEGETAVGERVLRDDRPHDLEALATGVARRLDQRAAARAIAGGERSVVFAPGVGGVLVHELVGHALEADTVARGGSYLARLAPPVAGAEVKVIDDPRRGRAPWRVDDEGEPARPTALVCDRRVAGLLHDLRSATGARQPTTGHARRSSYREPVRPRMGCTFLSAGDVAPEEALAGIDSGVYVRRMEVAAVDPASGLAWFRVTDADEIEAGRTGSPTRPFLLRVDAARALRGIERVATDLAFDVCVGTCLREGQPVATSVGAPTFRIGMATVLP